MRQLFAFFLVLAVIMSAEALAQTPATVTAEWVPSRTVYKISMLKAPNSQLAAIDGEMTDSSAITCDGSTVEQVMTLRFLPSDGGAEAVIKTSLTQWEASDGLSFRYINRTWANGQLVETNQGEAKLAGPGQGGSATSSLRKEPIALPPGTLFPTGLWHAVLRSASAGKSQLETSFFDGASTPSGGLSVVVATIGAMRPLGKTKGLVQPSGAAVSWPVQMAHYAPGSSDGIPYGQSGFSLMANGAAEAILLDIQQAKLRMDLTDYKVIPKPKC